MLLAPQIILNSLPTVQSNKSISGVMAEGDLWAVHALYLIVIVNPRFKTSLRLTGPRTASAMTKSGACYCPGIYDIKMFLDMGTYITPHIWMCIYDIFMYTCVYVVHPRQNLTKLGPDGREKTETHSELFPSCHCHQYGWWKWMPTHTFPSSPQWYSRPRWFSGGDLFFFVAF